MFNGILNQINAHICRPLTCITFYFEAYVHSKGNAESETYKILCISLYKVTNNFKRKQQFLSFKKHQRGILHFVIVNQLFN